MAAGRIKGITIEIDGNTSKLTKALSSVDNSIRNTQKNINDLNKALKLDPTNTNLLKDKQRELASEIDATKSKIETEKQALEQMKNTEGFDANSQAARNLQTQIDLDTAALKELESEARQSASVLGSQMQAAGQKIKAVGDDITNVGQKISGLGRTMTTKVTMPIAAGFGAVIKTTMDFDAQMSKVQAISGASGEEFAQLRDKAREMGESTRFSATEAGEAFEYMGMAGWKTEQMMQGIPGILNLAAASGEELGTTSDIVTDALTAFGLKAEDAGRFADILAAASTNANTNVSMMGESFKYAASAAGSLGYSAEDVTVALGLMANSGIKASMAGTSLRNMFQRMAKPTKESQAAMDRLGLSLQDDTGKMYSFRDIMDQIRESMKDINAPVEDYVDSLEALDVALANKELTQKQYEASVEELNKQTFGAEGAEKARAAAMLGGARAMAGLLAISNATEEDYEKLTSAIDDSSQAFARLEDGSVVPLNEALESGMTIMETYEGAAAAMAATMQDNLSGDITTLKSKLEELAISLGDLLMPTLREMVDGIKSVVDTLNGLDDETKKQIIQAALIVAAIGPVLMIVGGVITAIGTIVSAIGTLISVIGSVITFVSTIGPMIAAILPVIAAPVGIILGIVAAVGALIAVLVHLFNTNQEFHDNVVAIWEAVKAAIGAAFEQLMAWFASLGEALAPIGQAFMDTFSAIGEFIGTWVSLITTYISNFLENNKATIDAALGFIKMCWENAFTVIGGVVSIIVQNISTVITGWLSVLSNLFKAFTALLKGDWQSAWNYLVSAARSFVGILTGVFNNMVNGIKTIFTNLIQNFKSWGGEMISGLVQGIKDKIGDVKEAIGNIGEAIRERIHFSVPDVGPLADADSWMPDMMKLFAQGITDNASVITDAVEKSFNIRPLINNQNTLQGQNQTVAMQAAPISVNVVLEGDANRLYRVVRAEAVRNQQITGMSFA